MKSTVSFQGPGPFHLPAVQSATAVDHPVNGVTITFHALIEGRGSQQDSISVQMVGSVARELARDLVRALAEGDTGRGNAS
jgi:hypothetical protein